MDSSWGVPIVPKVLFKPVERFGRSRLGFGGVDSRVLFIARSPGHTGLTGASHRSDRCNPCWVFCSGERLGVFAVVLCCSYFEFGSVWSSVGLFSVLGFSSWDRCVASVWPVWSFSVEVSKFHQQGSVWPVVLTGLTVVGQWTRGLVFRCVLASEGSVLVPRSSGTWVVSRRRVLEAVFILLEFPLLREEFLSAPILSPLSGSPYRSFSAKRRRQRSWQRRAWCRCRGRPRPNFRRAQGQPW
jgi:hypothetical protein